MLEEPASNNSPRSQRARQHQARRAQVQAQAAQQSPSPALTLQPPQPLPPPPARLPRQPKRALGSSDEPLYHFPPNVPQPKWEPLPQGRNTPSTSRVQLTADDFFSSPKVAADIETHHPEEDESFFNSSLASEDFPDDIDLFGSGSNPVRKVCELDLRQSIDLEEDELDEGMEVTFDFSGGGDIFSHVPELSLPTLNSDGSSHPPLAPTPHAPAPPPAPPPAQPPAAPAQAPVQEPAPTPAQPPAAPAKAPVRAPDGPPSAPPAPAPVPALPAPASAPLVPTQPPLAPTSTTAPTPHQSPPSPTLDPDDATEHSAPALLPDFDTAQADCPAEDEEVGAECWDGLDGDTEDEDTYDSPQWQAPGRKTSQEIELLDEFCDKMNTLVNEYSEKTGCTSSNVVSHWSSEQGYSRVHRSTWNKYQMLYKANRMEERRRTGNPVASCNECFKAFKLHWGKDWKKVLDVQDKLLMEHRTNDSGYRRANEFRKYGKYVKRAAAKGHVVGFETVTLTVGNKLHHDQGLGKIVESEGARGFLDKLPIKGSTLVGPLQDYSFGSVAQKVQDEMGRQVQTKVPDLLNPNYKFSMEEDQPEASSSKSEAIPVAKTKSKASRKAQRGHSPSVSSVASTVTSQKDDDDEKQNIDLIKAYFYAECEHLGHYSFPTSQMPWSKLKSHVAGHNLTIAGWPEGVKFPVPYDRTNSVPEDEQQKIWKKRVGLRGIGTIQRRTLTAACVAKTLPLERHYGNKELLLNSHVPWIVGARPADRTVGQRQLFYRGDCIRLKAPGPCQPPSPHGGPSGSSSTPSISVATPNTGHSTPEFNAEEADASTPKAPAPITHGPPSINASSSPPIKAPSLFGVASTSVSKGPSSIASTSFSGGPSSPRAAGSVAKGPSRPISTWPVPVLPSFSHPECNPHPFEKIFGVKTSAAKGSKPHPFEKISGVKTSAAKGKQTSKAKKLAAPTPTPTVPPAANPAQTPAVPPAASSAQTATPTPPAQTAAPPPVQTAAPPPPVGPMQVPTPPAQTPAPPPMQVPTPPAQTPAPPPVQTAAPPAGPVQTPTPPSQPPAPAPATRSGPSVPPSLPTLDKLVQAPAQPPPAITTSAKQALEEGGGAAETKRPRGTTPTPSYTPYPMSMMGAMPSVVPMPHMSGVPHQMPGMHPMYGMVGQAPMFGNAPLSGTASPPPEGHFAMPYGFYPPYSYYPPMQQQMQQMQPYADPNFASQQTSENANPSNQP